MVGGTGLPLLCACPRHSFCHTATGSEIKPTNSKCESALLSLLICEQVTSDQQLYSYSGAVLQSLDTDKQPTARPCCGVPPVKRLWDPAPGPGTVWGALRKRSFCASIGGKTSWFGSFCEVLRLVAKLHGLEVFVKF